VASEAFDRVVHVKHTCRRKRTTHQPTDAPVSNIYYVVIMLLLCNYIIYFQYIKSHPPTHTNAAVINPDGLTSWVRGVFLLACGCLKCRSESYTSLVSRRTQADIGQNMSLRSCTYWETVWLGLLRKRRKKGTEGRERNEFTGRPSCRYINLL